MPGFPGDGRGSATSFSFGFAFVPGETGRAVGPFSINMKKISAFQIVFLAAVMIGLVILVNNRGTSSEDPCEIHRKLFTVEIDSGLVIDKYIDRSNYAMKTVVINAHGRNYMLLFIPFDNWDDFERIQRNDVIRKSPPTRFYLE